MTRRKLVFTFTLAFALAGMGALAACSAFSGNNATATPGEDAGDETSSDATSASDGAIPNGDAGSGDATSSPLDGAVDRCEAGCSIATQLDHPHGIAVDDGCVFVSERSPTGKVYCYPKDGGARGTLYQGDGITQIRTSGVGLYATVTNENVVRVLPGTVSTLLIAPALVVADDAGAFVSFNGAYVDSFLPALDSGIMKSFSTVGALAIDDDSVFIADPNQNQLYRFDRPAYTGQVNVQVKGVQDLATLGTRVYALALDTSRWIIGFDGKTLGDQQTVVSGLVAPRMLGADGNYLYYVDEDVLRRVHVVTHVPTDVYRAQNISAIAFDVNYIYIAIEGTGGGDGGDASAYDGTGSIVAIAK